GDRRRGLAAGAEEKEAPRDVRKGAVEPLKLLKEAAEAARSIEDPTHKVWSLMTVAEALAKAKAKDDSAKTFEEAVEVAKQVKGSQRSHRLSNVAEAQARAGDVKGAKETADLIDDNLGNRDGALSKIAIAQAAARDLKGAEETITTVASDPWKGEAERALAAAQVKAGKLKEAAKTAEGITNDLSRVVALLHVARAHRVA